ncbi:MAG TPA: enoate reductase, partial [Firmicutes bacterium]|nr:enoate reductase [Bacillota bacterium]
DESHVISAVELFKNPAAAREAKKVLVIGGGDVGCETAYFLACEKDKEVTVVEMLPYFMKESCTANRGHILHSLEQVGVRLWNCARVKQIDRKTVTVTRNISKSVPNPYTTWQPVLPDNVKNPLERPIRVEEKDEIAEADLVVLACGFTPDDSLFEKCAAEKAAPQVIHIGDCFSVGGVFEAVKAGYLTGRSI